MKDAIIESFDRMLESRSSPVAKDLKLNFRRLLEDSALSADEAAMVLLATAKATGAEPLREIARGALLGVGGSEEVIREVEESAAIMGMLNIYYRFRHFIDDQAEGEGYGAAKLRMQSLANPAIGKQRFEMLAFAVSVVNGCEKCVTSHEKALLQLGATREQIHDLARFAAVVVGLKQLLN